jgi:endoglucanase
MNNRERGCGRGVASSWAMVVVSAACAGGGAAPATSGVGGAAPDPEPPPVISHIRVNQLGYLPEDPKVAVVCSLEPVRFDSFTVEDGSGRPVFGPAPAREAPPFGPCRATHRLDFSALDREGAYRIRIRRAPSGPGAGGHDGVSDHDAAVSAPVRVSARAYDGAAELPLRYLRQQRSGYNPFFGDSVHHGTDGILVDHERAGEFIPVAGGWADAADYLQYGTTSANATFNLLVSYRDYPEAFGDRFDARGEPGGNGIPDILDEARHGLEWLLRMMPEDDLLLHQLGDDRDHAFLDLPTTDSSDYGWGRGGYRPVYPCTGRPQGLLGTHNRSTGMANIAGKYAAAFALGARILADRDPAFARTLAHRAVAAYRLGRVHPGVCQTAPAGAPYFYEEESWVDDMELAAAELLALTQDPAYLDHALEYARREPVTPWMGRDTARHYQWFPWHNAGHHEVWRQTDDPAVRERLAAYYRRGLARVAERADNGFLVGVPFIWCSNDLMASFATQALLYRRMTGDTTFIAHEAAALDWLLGTNPWGTSMVIGLPDGGEWPRDPHSVVAREHGVESQYGGLVDGPVYRSIYESLLYVSLRDTDEHASFNTGRVVYHDDWGDYATNEPILDGTANLVYLLASRTR